MPVPPLGNDAIAVLTKTAIQDRVINCTFGSALGDAIGLYTEFLSVENPLGLTRHVHSRFSQHRRRHPFVAMHTVIRTSQANGPTIPTKPC
jgi:hypothetical protein